MSVKTSSSAPEAPSTDGGVCPPPAARPRRRASRVREFSARDLSARVNRSAEVVEALARQYRILDTLREAANQLVVHRPLPELFELLLDLLFAAVPAQRGAILLREQDPARLQLKASRSRTGLPFVSVSRAIADRVLERGQGAPARRCDAPSRLQQRRQHHQRRHPQRPCAPFGSRAGRRTRWSGLVYLDNSSFVDAFDEEDLGLVTAIASVAAVKIHTRLLRESRDNRRLKEESPPRRRDAGRPPCPRRLPCFRAGAWPEGAGPAWRWVGTTTDWALGEDGLRLVLADVSGKARPRPCSWPRCGRSVRSRWSGPTSPRASRLVSRAVFDNVPASRYATAFLARPRPAHRPFALRERRASARADRPRGRHPRRRWPAASPAGPDGIGLLHRGGRDARPGRHPAHLLGRRQRARDASGNADRRRAPGWSSVRGGPETSTRPASCRGSSRPWTSSRPARPADDDRTLLVLKRVDPPAPDGRPISATSVPVMPARNAKGPAARNDGSRPMVGATRGPSLNA